VAVPPLDPTMRRRIRTSAFLTTLAAAACAPAPDREPADPGAAAAADTQETGAAREAAERETARIDAEAARIDSVFQPLPLLRPGEEAALRRFGNAHHLARARALGVGRLLPPERLERLVAEGGLVRLEDGPHWVVRDLEFSLPLVVPAAHAMLTELGERFHARLAALGAPPFRMEVSSVLRSAEEQAALRRVNPNAAAGESAHEHGTTVDVLYAAFAAPLRPIVEVDAGDAAWLEPLLARYAAVAAERVAARRALELKAILGRVLVEMQAEGKVLVTVERLQPVYHLTVGRG
jgi:hypothetical protein